MSILTPPLSKRGILKALGQDPSKSDVLTVSTNPDGMVRKSPLLTIGGEKIQLGSSGFLPVVPTLTETADRIIASRLNDGCVYKISGTVLWSSKDGDNWTSLGTFVATARLLLPAGDGEVLVAAGPGGMYRSTGWGKSNPVTLTQVINTNGDSDILSLSCDSDGAGRCVTAHYRATDYTKSHYVWYSDDCGKNWRIILDINNLDGGLWHLHFAIFDKWAPGRIIVCYHGNDGQGVFGKTVKYTDDLGATWVTITDAWQPSTCVATRHGLVMGTDDAPSGILVARRNTDGTYATPRLVANAAVEKAPVAYQAAIYSQIDPETEIVYTALYSQSNGTPASVFASDGITATEIWRSGAVKQSEGLWEFGILPSGKIVGYVVASENLGTSKTYIWKSALPERGQLGSGMWDTGRVGGGTVIGDNRFTNVAIGPYSTAGIAPYCTSAGHGATSGAQDVGQPRGSAFGAFASANWAGASAIGAYSVANFSGTALGESANASTQAVAIGRGASAGNNGTATGRSAAATGVGSSAYGLSATATHVDSVVLGRNSVSTRDACVAVGSRDIESTGSGKGLILRSPNGTAYRIAVSDAGVVSATAL